MPQQNQSKKSIDDIHEIHEYSGKRWPVAAAYLASAFLVALIVVFGGRWAYRALSNEPTKSSSNQSSASQKNEPAVNRAGANEAVIVPASPSKGSVKAPGSAKQQPAPQSVPDTGDTLPNTGG